jgi:hypothetical protein
MNMNDILGRCIRALLFASLSVGPTVQAAEPSGIEHKYVEVNSIRLHYVTAGQGLSRAQRWA